MRKMLVFAVALAAIVFATAAHKPSGPVIIDAEEVIVPSGTTSTVTMDTPIETGMYAAYLQVPAGGCPSPGGGDVFATDPGNSTVRVVTNSLSFLAEAGTPIYYTLAGPCTVYVVLEQF